MFLSRGYPKDRDKSDEHNINRTDKIILFLIVIDYCYSYLLLYDTQYLVLQTEISRQCFLFYNN